MKKILTILAFVFLATSSLVAQQANEEQLHKPGIMNQVRDLVTVLELDMDQLQIVKDYYGRTSVDERRELKTVTSPVQRRIIQGRYQQERDEKVRSILTEQQLPVFDSYLIDRAAAQSGGLGDN